MCGFVGIVELDGAPADRGLLSRMTTILRHRGPDDEGLYVDGPIGLGFRRLSILDLSPSGHQPMASADGRYVMVFNGEIYNYLELRGELQRAGHTFASTGDSEVLLRAYMQWGPACLTRLNGMWSFLIYDTREHKLFGSRDRFGKKPLYLRRAPRSIVLASEIKAILASGRSDGATNWNMVAKLLLGGSFDQLDTDVETFYAGIEQVPAGSAFELGLDGTMKRWRYWSLPACSDDAPADPAGALAELFEDAVRLRLRSDVPAGIFLSGGLDSTSIACATARLLPLADLVERVGPFRAFAFQADEFDETRYIQETIARTGIELIPFRPDPRDLWRKLSEILWYQDEPIHSMAAVITFELSRLAASHGVKVILNGGGSDESLAGYLSFFHDYWHGVLREGGRPALRQAIEAFRAAHGGDTEALTAAVLRRATRARLGRLAPYRRLSRWRRRRDLGRDRWYTRDLGRHLRFADRGHEPPTLDAALRRSVERAPLPLYLRIEDRNSMAHSIEARMPFLDYRIIELAFRLPDAWKVRGPWNKYVLREAMQGRIPESVRARTDKMGFAVPAREWFARWLYEPMCDLLASQPVRERGFYDLAAIRRDLESHRQGRIDVSSRAFNLVQFEMWAGLEHGLPTDPSGDAAQLADGARRAN